MVENAFRNVAFETLVFLQDIGVTSQTKFWRLLFDDNWAIIASAFELRERNGAEVTPDAFAPCLFDLATDMAIILDTT